MNIKMSMWAYRMSFAAILVLLAAGCQTSKTQIAGNPAPPVPALQPTVGTPLVADPNAAFSPLPDTRCVIRVKAGTTDSYKDACGNVWFADKGFSGGDTIERPDVTIQNTSEPGIYRSEHYGMDAFACSVPNGKYLVKLHFCETFDGIEGPGQRVFSFNVQGREFKDFDVWVKAGGPLKAYVESVPVEIKDGTLKITFTSQIENPQVNGIEIIPQA